MTTAAPKKWQFWRSTRPSAQLSVFIGAEAAWACCADKPDEARFYAHQHDWKVLWGNIANDFGSATVQLVLGAGSYQIIAADKPAIPEDEIPQALLWSIKDMVAIPASNIHLDYFEFPSATNNKLQVVVTDKAQMMQLAQAVVDNGLVVAGISIEELMPANLFGVEPQARLVICHVPSEEVLLTVVRDGELWMQRRLRGYSELDSLTAEALQFGLADNLSLEIQRSMDFFESQLRQAPVTSIELLCGGEQQLLAQLIGANFNQPVNVIDANDIGGKMAALGLLELQRGGKHD